MQREDYDEIGIFRGRTMGTVINVTARPMKRTAQTYCECGAKKGDRKKYCVTCTDSRITFNSQNPEAKRRAYRRLVAKQKDAARDTI